jgi:hypothetical protein
MYTGVDGQGGADGSGGTRHGDLPRFGVEDLTTLLTGAEGLADTMERIAEYAVDAFPHVDGVAVRIVGECAMSVVHGVPAARMADELHDVLMEGPAIEAFTEGRIVLCGSLGGSEKWQRFGPRVGRLGLHSVLSIPLFVPAIPVGVITAYSHTKDAFFQVDADIAERYGPPAAAVLYSAYLRERERRRVAQLTKALEVRPQIDRAIGIMMSRTAKSPEQALASLRRQSNVRQVKVAALADEVVDTAVRRARQRRVTRSDE